MGMAVQRASAVHDCVDHGREDTGLEGLIAADATIGIDDRCLDLIRRLWLMAGGEGPAGNAWKLTAGAAVVALRRSQVTAVLPALSAFNTVTPYAVDVAVAWRNGNGRSDVVVTSC